MILGQTAKAIASSLSESVIQIESSYQNLNEDTDCHNEDESISQTQANEESERSVSIFKSASDCKPKTCSGSECFVTGFCGNGSLYINNNNSYSIFEPEIISLCLNYNPASIFAINHSPPIKPPIV